VPAHRQELPILLVAGPAHGFPLDDTQREVKAMLEDGTG